jgi:hypothetical protein
MWGALKRRDVRPWTPAYLGNPQENKGAHGGTPLHLCDRGTRDGKTAREVYGSLTLSLPEDFRGVLDLGMGRISSRAGDN